MSTFLYGKDNIFEDTYTQLSISTEELVQFVSDDAEIVNSFRSDKQAGLRFEDYFPVTAPMPLNHRIALVSMIVILTIFLSSLVLKFYLKSKDYARPYILALVVIDFASVFFSLIPNVVLNFPSLDVEIFEVIFTFYLTSMALSFGLYLYPSFFLALDRFVVVLFPLKFREMTSYIRGIKFTLLGIHSFFIMLGVVVAELFGLNSPPSVVTKSIYNILNTFVLFSITVMYATMVVMIIKTSRQMASTMQHGNAKNR